MRSIRAGTRESERRFGGSGCGNARILGLALATSLAGCSSASTPSATPSASATPVGSLPTGLVSPGSPGLVSRPTFGPTVTASVPPPPLSGGTLLVTRDGSRAIAADPERDSVYVVNLKTHSVDFTIALTVGDEPGRLVEDGAGRVHVALRSGGALATLDPSKGALIDRRNVCPAPRGVAWDASTDLVWVACATGELVALPAAGGPAAHTFAVERDLRDVVVGQGSLAVTKFRSAEVLRIASNGTIARRDALPSPEDGFAAHVAWRAVGGPSGTVVAVHQAESTTSVETHAQGGYGGGGGCGGLPSGPPVGTGGSPGEPPESFDDASVLPDIDSGLAAAPTDAEAQDSAAVDSGAQGLSVDSGAMGFMANDVLVVGKANPQSCSNSAASSGGDLPIAFLSQGAPSSGLAFGGCPPSGVVLDVLTELGPDGRVLVNSAFPGVLPVDVAVSPDGSVVAAVAPGNAFTSGLDTVFVFTACGNQEQSTSILGANGTSEQPTAVAFEGSDQLVVQTRQPAELHIYGGATPVVIALSSESHADTGHDIFHTQAGAMIACASCHPEGRDDGHVWILDDSRRRTPSLQGTIAGTAPYHWPGDEANLDVLVDDVYTIRMNGTRLPGDEQAALTGWVQTVPAPPAPASAKSDASQRGQVLFERADVGCSTCHSGSKFTNNQTVDVGTGGAFQVPPLVGVGWRTPLMHDGCAATIADRFGSCSTAAHGSIGGLSARDISDLIAYLETL